MSGKRSGRARLRVKPREQLVAQESQLSPTGEPVTRHLSLPYELAQVFDVDLEELSGQRGGEDGRVLVHSPSRLRERAA